MNKKLKELKENSNKQMNEIKKTIQDMKEELNKEKRINFMNISISPPKNLN
jgi:Sec-independent protein translocase protein TatA